MIDTVGENNVCDHRRTCKQNQSQTTYTGTRQAYDIIITNATHALDAPGTHPRIWKHLQAHAQLAPRPFTRPFEREVYLLPRTATTPCGPHPPHSRFSLALFGQTVPLTALSSPQRLSPTSNSRVHSSADLAFCNPLPVRKHALPSTILRPETLVAEQC